MNATPFMQPWGYDKLVNGTNVIGSSLEVWKHAGAQGIAMDLTWGFIPIVLFTMVYIRYQRIDAAMFVGLVSTLTLKAFNLISPFTSRFLWITMAVGLGLSLAYKYFNKN